MLGWTRRHVAGAAAAATALCLLAGGCGSGRHPSAGGRARPQSPSALLIAARTALDRTPALHFVLTSAGVPTSGIQLTGATGDLVRPASMKGTFSVTQSGVPLSVGVVSVGSAFYVQLPLSSKFTEVSPSQFGFGNPALLINPTDGVSGLLSDEAGDARSLGQRRIAGLLVDEVTGTVPGSKVPVLPDADRSEPVKMTVAVDPANDQIREVVLAGPFISKGTTTTYTVMLSGYGEHVAVAAPTG